MKFYIVASGSRGNATLIYSLGHLILIDMGITKKELVDSLTKHGFTFDDIEAVFFTHEHNDHTKGLPLFKNYKKKLYGSYGTFDVLEENELEPYKSYCIAGFKVTPISISHDAYRPLGYIFESNDQKLVYITDTGYMIEESLNLSKNADYYIFESNHDVNKLLQTNRPDYLKERILSDVGHLSNFDSAHYMLQMIGDNTKEIYLAHISLEANTPELVLDSYKKIFKKMHKDINKYKVVCTKQFEEVEGGIDD